MTWLVSHRMIKARELKQQQIQMTDSTKQKQRKSSFNNVFELEQEWQVTPNNLCQREFLEGLWNKQNEK